MLRKFWVKLDFPNFILDTKSTEKGFIIWPKTFYKVGPNLSPEPALELNPYKINLASENYENLQEYSRHDNEQLCRRTFIQNQSLS